MKLLDQKSTRSTLDSTPIPNMNLRTTTIVFVGLAFFGLIAVLLTSQEVTLMRHFNQLEQQTASEALRQGQAALQSELDELDSLGAYLLHRSNAAEELVNNQVITGFQIERVVLLDGEGSTRLDRSLLPEGEPDGLAQWLTAHPAGGQGAWTGANGVLLVAAQARGEQGQLALGRYLNNDELARLAERWRLSLVVQPLNGGQLDARYQTAVDALSSGQAEYFSPLDEVTLSGFTRIYDLDGQPAALLEVQMARVIQRSGRIVRYFQNIALILSAIIFGATILYVLEGLVISRIRRLDREVTQIGQTGDLSERVTVKLKDELTSLSENINTMLESLELAQIKRAELFEQVRAGQESLQRLSRQLVNVQEAERRRIALELHDEIGQALTGLKLAMSGGETLSAERLREVQTQLNDLIQQVRTLSLDLRPAMLDDLGLLPALVWQIDRFSGQSGLRVNFQHSGLQGKRFPPEVETAAFRVAQEALTNAARYSQASQVNVRAWASAETLGVQVEDDGVGFDPQAALEAASSSGLAGMRERVVLLKGDFELETSPGSGACLTVLFPVNGTQKEGAHGDIHPAG